MPVIHCKLIRSSYISSVSRSPPLINNDINAEGTVGPVYQTQLLYEQAQTFDESRLRAIFGELIVNVPTSSLSRYFTRYCLIRGL